MAALPQYSAATNDTIEKIKNNTEMSLSELLNCFSEMKNHFNEKDSKMAKDKYRSPFSNTDFFTHMSLEIICHILNYLPLRDVLKMEQQCRKIQKAVSMHLHVRKSIDLTEGEILGWIPTSLNDFMLTRLISRCVELTSIYGFHCKNILKRRQRGVEMLTIPGTIAALSSAPNLKGIEVSDISLMEAILNYLPHLEILGTFKNRNGGFPVNSSNRLILTSNPKITSLHLTGVVISELPRMSFVKHLYLRSVRITHFHPFRDLSVPSLQSFVMSNCAGPTSTLKYVPLLTGLAAARSLTRMELVRVPFLGGLIQHIVEDSWRLNGFSNLQTVTLGACKHAQEVDLGYMMITAAHGLEDLNIQPSLTKDSLFAAIKMADVSFPAFENLHLGYVDSFPEPGKWNAEDLIMLHGLAEVSESPAMITDIGMKAIGQCFTELRNLEVYNCPHLHFPMSWITQGADTWSNLRHLCLRRCHAIRLQDFCRFLGQLPQLEVLLLECMFREPPKGCTRVGLSAGTGLGVSSALVQNNGNDIGNHNDNGQDDNNNINPVVAAAAGDVNNNNPANQNVPNYAHVVPPPPQEDDGSAENADDDDDDLLDDLLDDWLGASDDDNEDKANDDDVSPHLESSQKKVDTDDGNEIVSGSVTECRACSSHAKGSDEPQPSTSWDYPGKAKGSSKRESNAAAVPTVDHRSTCQLVDIDIGNDSDMDSDCPADGKIKVKVESTSTLDCFPKDDVFGVETKTVSHTSDSSVIDNLPLGKAGPLQTMCNGSQRNTKATSRRASVNNDISQASGSTEGVDQHNLVLRKLKSDEECSKCSDQTTRSKEVCSPPLKKRKSCSSENDSQVSGKCAKEMMNSVETNNIPSSCSSSCDISPQLGNKDGLLDSNPSDSHEESGEAVLQEDSEKCVQSQNVDDVITVTCPSGSDEEHYVHTAAECSKPAAESKPMPLKSEAVASTSVASALDSMSSEQMMDGSTSSEAKPDSTLQCKKSTELKEISEDENAQANSDDASARTVERILEEFARDMADDSEEDLSGYHDPRYLFSQEEVRAMGFGDYNICDDGRERAHETKTYNMRPRKGRQHTVAGGRVPAAGITAVASTSGTVASKSKERRSGPWNVHGADLGMISDESSQEASPRASGRAYEYSDDDLDMRTTEDFSRGTGGVASARGSSRGHNEAVGGGKNFSIDKDAEARTYNMRPRKRGKSLTGKKKGLVKKRRKTENVKTDPNMHDKCCQAVSDDIRETTKRAKEQEDAEASTSCGKAKGGNSCSSAGRVTRKTRSSSSSMNTSAMVLRKMASHSRSEPIVFKPVLRKSNMVDISTSTSDPVIEDDHIQVLSLRSKSLLCVTLYMVGVTDVIVDDCPNLTLLRGSACRVLKKVTVGGAPRLSRVSFTQCRKIDEMHLVNEVCDQISQTNRVICLRPMREFDLHAFESMLFCQPDIDYHLCVIYDYSPDPAETMYNRHRVSAWLDLLTGINLEMLRFNDFEQAKNFPVNNEDDEEKCYRNAYILHGYNSNGSEWQLSTDIPWLDLLSQCPDVSSPELHPDDYKEGLYCPKRKGHQVMTNCLMDINGSIAEMKDDGISLYVYSVIVYINMCDTSGTPAPDIYL